MGGSTLVIPYSDLCRYVGLIPGRSVRKNRSRISRTLRDEIGRYASFMKVTDTDEVMELVRWLCSHWGEERQRIIYQVAKPAL